MIAPCASSDQTTPTSQRQGIPMFSAVAPAGSTLELALAGQGSIKPARVVVVHDQTRLLDHGADHRETDIVLQVARSCWNGGAECCVNVSALRLLAAGPLFESSVLSCPSTLYRDYRKVPHA
jgi:hypothetical protein